MDTSAGISMSCLNFSFPDLIVRFLEVAKQSAFEGRTR
jgi:hypothetical protein